MCSSDLIGKGRSLQEIIASTPMVVEGVPTTKAAFTLSQRFKVELPIVEKTYHILFGEARPRQAVEELMGRDRRDGIESIC